MTFAAAEGGGTVVTMQFARDPLAKGQSAPEAAELVQWPNEKG
jgi:hypothetical protein